MVCSIALLQYTPASLRKYSIVNQEMQTASIREKIGFSIVASPLRFELLEFAFKVLTFKICLQGQSLLACLTIKVNNLELWHCVHAPIEHESLN